MFIFVGVVIIFIMILINNDIYVMKEEITCIPRWLASGGAFKEFPGHNLGGSQWHIIEFVNDEAETFNRSMTNSNCAGIVHTNWNNRFYLKSGRNNSHAMKKDLVCANNYNAWLKTCDA